MVLHHCNMLPGGDDDDDDEALEDDEDADEADYSEIIAEYSRVGGCGCVCVCVRVCVKVGNVFSMHSSL